jgi:hypothetical protein
VRRSFDRATLAPLREMPSEDALALLAVYCKMDPTFQPVKHATTRRWHVCATGGEFELLTTGPKWFDARAKKGGGGAIDLAMHILHLSFVEAVNLLIERRHLRG